MFDLCAERLVECEERFAERNGHRFVEIWDIGDSRTPIYRCGDLKEKEIAGWVHEDRSAGGPVQAGLRVLLSPKPSGKPSSGKLPFTRETYQSLSHAWCIPSTFLRAVTQKLSIVTQCSVAPCISSPTSSPSFPWFSQDRKYPAEAGSRSSKISDQAKCLLVRGDVDWTWDYTLLLTHDPTTSTTYVLIVGLTATEIDLVISYLAQLSYASPPHVSTHPSLLPIILLDLAADETSSLLKLRIKLLSQIQQRTGMDRFNSLKSATIAGTARGGGVEARKSLGDERQDLDLDAVMLRLTCLSDWVAAQKSFVGLQERVVKTVEGMLGGNGTGMEDARMFRERLDFVRQTLLAAEEKCQYLERSISAQVQTIYSLIAQKDNRLNHSATSASCQIASDSRRIAILTRRDSTDMRIIAAVTLIFLPGTFVATVFSTGLFDWGNGDPTQNNDSGGSESGGGNMVSRYIWVYFMLTGALTAVVLVAWILFSWVQKRNMVRRFGFDLEEGGDVMEETGNSGKRRDTETTLVERKKAFDRWRDEMLGTWKRPWRKGQDEKVLAEEQVKVA